MLLSKCAISGSRKWRFMKEQEAKRTLCSLDLNTALSKFPLFGDILFWTQFRWRIWNEIINKFSLPGEIYAWNAFKTAWIYL